MRPLALLVLLALAAPATAQVTAPDGSVPLSEILAGIEAGGERTVHSAEFELRRWEVLSCPGRSRFCREDYVNPTTGAITASENTGVMMMPPRDGLPASAIAASVEAMGLGSITEIEFDDRRWDVEIRNGLRSAELRIDPRSGEVQRCEGSLCP